MFKTYALDETKLQIAYRRFRLESNALNNEYEAFTRQMRLFAREMLHHYNAKPDIWLPDDPTLVRQLDKSHLLMVKNKEISQRNHLESLS